MKTAFAASEFDPAVHLRLLPSIPQPPSLVDDFIAIRDYSFFYDSRTALDAVTLSVRNHRVTALIGPSGCGKSTLLRSLNRMNDLIPGARRKGDILLGGQSIHDRRLPLMNLRRTVGMVFQKSNPLPLTVAENVACAVRVPGAVPRAEVAARVEQSLRRVGLWEEVKDRLDHDAAILSGGQLQRLCIARALACHPQILLLDEPCSSLDPVATARIEELIVELGRELTVVLVTHNIGQAVRCADHAAFFYQGRLVEDGSSEDIFVNPREATTAAYLEGAIW